MLALRASCQGVLPPWTPKNKREPGRFIHRPEGSACHDTGHRKAGQDDPYYDST